MSESLLSVLPAQWGTLIAAGTFNQSASRLGKFAGSQCLFNAVAFLRSVFLYGIEKSADAAALDRILLQGTELAEKSLSQVRYADCADIPLLITTPRAATLVIRSSTYGNVPLMQTVSPEDEAAISSSSELIAANAFKVTREIVPKRTSRPTDSMIVTVGAFVVAIWRQNQHLYIFEPHGSRGSPAFVSLIDLAGFYNWLLNYGKKSDSFTLNFLYFSVTQPGTAEVHSVADVRAFLAAEYGATDIASSQLAERREVSLPGLEEEVPRANLPAIEGFLAARRTARKRRKKRESPKATNSSGDEEPLKRRVPVSAEDAELEEETEDPFAWATAETGNRDANQNELLEREKERLLSVVVRAVAVTNDNLPHSVVRFGLHRLFAFLLENGVSAILGSEGPLGPVIREIGSFGRVTAAFPAMVEFLTQTELKMEEVVSRPDLLSLAGPDAEIKVARVIAVVEERTKNLLDVLREAENSALNAAPEKASEVFEETLQPLVQLRYNALFATRVREIDVLDAVRRAAGRAAAVRTGNLSRRRLTQDLFERLIDAASRVLTGNESYEPVSFAELPDNVPAQNPTEERERDLAYRTLARLADDKGREALKLYEAKINYDLKAAREARSHLILVQSPWLDRLSSLSKSLSDFVSQSRQFADRVPGARASEIDRLQSIEALRLLVAAEPGARGDGGVPSEEWAEAVRNAAAGGFIGDAEKLLSSVSDLKEAAERVELGKKALASLANQMSVARELATEGERGTRAPEEVRKGLEAVRSAVAVERAKETDPERKRELNAFEVELAAALKDNARREADVRASEEKLSEKLQNLLKPSKNLNTLRFLDERLRGLESASELLREREEERITVVTDLLSLLAVYGKTALKWNAIELEGLSPAFAKAIDLTGLQQQLSKERAFFAERADSFVAALAAAADRRAEPDRMRKLAEEAEDAYSAYGLTFLRQVASEARAKLGEAEAEERRQHVSAELNRAATEISAVESAYLARPTTEGFSLVLDRLEDVDRRVSDLGLSEMEKERHAKLLNGLESARSRLEEAYAEAAANFASREQDSAYAAFARYVRETFQDSIDNSVFDTNRYAIVAQEAARFRDHEGFERLVEEADDLLARVVDLVDRNLELFLQFNPYDPDNKNQEPPISLLTGLNWVGGLAGVLPDLATAFDASIARARSRTELFNRFHSAVLSRPPSALDFHELVRQNQNELRMFDVLQRFVPFYLNQYEEYQEVRRALEQAASTLAELHRWSAAEAAADSFHRWYDKPQLEQARASIRRVDPADFRDTAYEKYVARTVEREKRNLRLLEEDEDRGRKELARAMEELKRKLLLGAPTDLAPRIRDARNSGELVDLWIETLDRGDLNEERRPATELLPLATWLKSAYLPITRTPMETVKEDLSGPLADYESRLERFVARIGKAADLEGRVKESTALANVQFEKMKDALRLAEKEGSDETRDEARGAVAQARAALEVLERVSEDGGLLRLLEEKTRDGLSKALELRGRVGQEEARLTETDRLLSQLEAFLSRVGQTVAYDDVLADLATVDEYRRKAPADRRKRLIPVKEMLELRRLLYRSYGDSPGRAAINRLRPEFTPPPPDREAEAIVNARLMRFAARRNVGVLTVRLHESEVDPMFPTAFLTLDGDVIPYAFVYPTVCEKFVALENPPLLRTDHARADEELKVPLGTQYAATAVRLAVSMVETDAVVTSHEETRLHYINYVTSGSWAPDDQPFATAVRVLYDFTLRAVWRTRYPKTGDLWLSTAAGPVSETDPVLRSPLDRSELNARDALLLLAAFCPWHVALFARLPHVEQLEFVSKTLEPLLSEAAVGRLAVSRLSGKQGPRLLPVLSADEEKSPRVFGLRLRDWRSFQVTPSLTFPEIWLQTGAAEATPSAEGLRELQRLTDDGKAFATLLYALAYHCVPPAILEMLWNALRPRDLPDEADASIFYRQRALPGESFVVSESTVALQTERGEIPPDERLWIPQARARTLTVGETRSKAPPCAFDFAIFAVLTGVPLVIAATLAPGAGFSRESGLFLGRVLLDARSGDAVFDEVRQAVSSDVNFLAAIEKEYQPIENVCLKEQIVQISMELSRQRLKTAAPLLVLVDEDHEVTHLLAENPKTAEKELIFHFRVPEMEDVRIPSGAQETFLPSAPPPGDPLFETALGFPPNAISYERDGIEGTLNHRPVYEKRPPTPEIFTPPESPTTNSHPRWYDDKEIEDWSFPSPPDSPGFSEPEAPPAKPPVSTRPIPPDLVLSPRDAYPVDEGGLGPIPEEGPLRSLVRRSLLSLLEKIRALRRFAQKTGESLLTDIQRIKLFLR
ncbi:F-UL-36 protein [Chelonid alphaherpesvirus 5]|uniref:F-UL-36 protein n=1 Tax=Chelonid alphaherpesvirus 5 TaxID=702736 RepID=V5NWY7_9ALPH|nr:F-UL-36 protein [Chelonid alphaherpesvirus 5]AHA93365.1 F-UL-36 protein [Chelonid alphaherpesvirus 5]